MTDRPRPPESRPEEHTPEPGVLQETANLLREIYRAKLDNAGGTGLPERATAVKEMADEIKDALGATLREWSSNVTDSLRAIRDRAVETKIYNELTEKWGNNGDPIEVDQQYQRISDPQAHATVHAIADAAAEGRPVTIEVQRIADKQDPHTLTTSYETVPATLTAAYSENGVLHYNLENPLKGVSTGGDNFIFLYASVMQRITPENGSTIYNLHATIGPKEQTDSPTEA